MSMSITFADRSAGASSKALEVTQSRPAADAQRAPAGVQRRPVEDLVLLTVAVADSQRTYTCVMPETARVQAAVSSITGAPAESVASQGARLGRAAATLITA